MADITLAEHAGFCFGVKEALSKAEETIKEYEGRNVKLYSHGPLIHNKAVTGELEKKGLIIINDLSQVQKGSVIIIRSHGEAEAFYREAESKELMIVDTTCPFVSRIHEIVKEAAGEGRNIVVVGDANHPEVKGIKGWAGGECRVIGSIDEAKKVSFDRITLVAQTTIDGQLWNSVESWLKKNKEDVTVINTICNATAERQRSCEKLAQESDLMVVIGDKDSANTKKLYEIAKNNCANVLFIEKAEEISLKQIELCDRIGIAAGASAPERIIKEVIAAMSELITGNEEMQETEAQETHMTDSPAKESETQEELQEEPVMEKAQEEPKEEAVGSEAQETPEEEAVASETQEEPKEEAVAAEEAQEPEPIAEAASGEEKNLMHDFMDQIDKSLKLPNRGEIVDGEIVQVTDKEIVVNLGYKKDGILPREELTLEGEQELTELFKEGDTIQAKVIKTDDGDGNILLSKKRLEVNGHWDEISEALDNKTVVNAKVIKEVKGGVIALYKEVSGFIPMSQLSDRYVEKADEFIGRILPVKVSRVDQRRNKAVFSHKAYLAEEKQKKIQEIWESLKVGDNVEGTVMRFTDYGAFVDIGGLDGLLHISEISWGKLRHPQEALDIGEIITVKILSMNSEKGKISLGLKQNQPEPWSIIDEKYAEGQVVEGKVVQIKEYGAFVELMPGLDGLVHISEIAHKRVGNIADELSTGQIVKTKILEIDKDRRRISLSIKATIDPFIYEEKEEESFSDNIEIEETIKTEEEISAANPDSAQSEESSKDVSKESGDDETGVEEQPEI